MKTRNTITVMAVFAIIALAFFACKDGDDDTHTHEWEWKVTAEGSATADRIETETCTICSATNSTRPLPLYREAEIVFTFTDTEGIALVGGPHKANAKGTMILADYNTAKSTTQTKINTAQDTATGPRRGRFGSAFADDQNASIIFDPNAGNGKYEIKDGEWRNLYINPSALNSITDDEYLDAITAMLNEEPKSE